ncbi:MAG: 3-guanidinopropionate transporter [Rhodomicrobium sp.]|nr:MAG: 3-guanidinopropionate transporter [Rhodomicrobium sp.]
MADGSILFIGVFSALYLLVLVATQIRLSGRESSLAEFFVAARSIKLPAAIATLGATEIGLITIAYNAQKGFGEGFSAFHIGIAALIGCLFVGLTGFVVAPLRRTGVLTVAEFYEQRFGRDIRVVGGFIMVLAGVLNMGLFLKVAALYILPFLPAEIGGASIEVIMVTLIAIAVAYTAFGGMRAVIVTDVLQFVVMVLGLIAVIVFLLEVVPLAEAITRVRELKGEGGFNPLLTSGFGLDYMLWMIVVAGIASAAIWPTALSRALCIQDEATTKRAYLISSLLFAGRMILPAFIGILAFTFLARSGAGAVELTGDAKLAATAQFLAEVLPPFLAGLIVVVFFASFMSTQDGYLFCWASLLSRDVVGPLVNRVDDVAFQKRWTRIFIVLIALYELYWGLIYDGTEDVWNYLAITGSIYFCSGIVLLTGGLYWRGATRLGAWGALLFGLSAILAFGPIKEATGFAGWSEAQIGFFSIGLSVFGLVAGSLIERQFASRSA